MDRNSLSQVALLLIGVFLIASVARLPVMAQSGDVSASISQIDKSDFPKIDVYISLIDSSGQPVKAVPASAFTLFENGTPLHSSEIDLEGSREPVSYMLVIDRSGSMGEVGKMVGAQEAAIRFIDLFRSGDSGGVIAFDSQVDLLHQFTTDREALARTIRRISPDGRTAFYDALEMALDEVEPIAGRKSIIALTDGLDNQSAHTANQVIELAKDANIPIYTIGLGDTSQSLESEGGVDEDVLTTIAEQSGAYYAFSPTADELTALYSLRSEQIQNEYKLSYISPNDRQDGSNREIRLLINLDGSTFEAEGQFNPGGVIPETTVTDVAPDELVRTYNAWFFGALILLLGLLMTPMTIQQSRVLASDWYFNFKYVKKVKPGSEYIGRTCLSEGPEASQYAINAKDTIVICPSCQAVYHLDCWLEESVFNKQCGVTGCSGKGNPRLKVKV